MQVVTQQAGEATVMLYRSDTAGSLQVRVTTEPSPVVGVNVSAVDQTVTFADGQREAAVTVPILPGAPNPGEVDVSLDVRPIDPSPSDYYSTASGLDLRIVRNSDSVSSMRLQSAQYDPATQSVTLIPSNPNLLNDSSTPKVVHPAKSSLRPRHRLDFAQGLTDLQGNPINVDTTPGKVKLRLTRQIFSRGGGFA